jgi:hypothetical protein
MARLPNSDQLILELRKLEDYCLSPSHPRGRHKARVFRNALGLTRDDAEWLRNTLIDAARRADAVALESDAAGQRWRVDIAVARQDRRAMIRTLWIMRHGENAPRFVTCWVL